MRANSRMDGAVGEARSAVVAAWPLAGRDAALDALRGRLLGGGPGVVIAGPLGVGKSRLAAEGLRLAAAAGLATARVTATRSSRRIPLGAFAPLLPAPRGEQPGRVDDRADLLRRCAGAILTRGGGGRLVLLVDDAHLLDDLSATLLSQLVASGVVAVLATVRCREPAPDPVVALWKDGLAERIELAGLDRDTVSGLLAAVLGGPVDDATTVELDRRARGNILYLRELVLGAIDAGVLAWDGAAWTLDGELRPPDRLVELVEARLAGLGDAERALLEVVSFGEPLGPAELGGLGDPDVAETLERKGLLLSRADGMRVTVTLAHPIYGEVLRTRVPALRARSIARSLAEAVEATGCRRREDILRVAAWRLVGGGASPDRMLDAAGAARWRYDFPLAERLARAAAAAGAGFEADLLVAELAGLQGRSAEASAELALLATGATGDDQRARVALARIDNRVIYAGTIDEGLKLAEEADEALAGTDWHDGIAARRAALLLATEGPRRALTVAEPLLGGSSGSALVWACMPAAYSLGRMGRVDEAIRATHIGMDAQLALDLPMDWYPWMHLFYRAEALAHAGRFAEAEAIALEQYRAGLERRSVEAQATFSWQLSKWAADRGNVEDAVRRAQRAVNLFRRLGRPQFVDFALVYLATALALGRRSADAAAALAERDGLGFATSYFMGIDPIQAKGWAAVSGGDLRRAAACFAEAADEGERIGDLVGAAAALHNLARIGRARDVDARLADLAAGLEGDLATTRAAHTAALAGGDAERLLCASGDFEGLGADLLGAEAAADAAVVWRRRDEPRRAASAERQAAWLASRCAGADTPALQEAECRARLTAAEWDTAQLAATGRSNKSIAEHLIVSVRTVENRLQHIYGKIGVSSRADLAAALATLADPAA